MVLHEQRGGAPKVPEVGTGSSSSSSSANAAKEHMIASSLMRESGSALSLVLKRTSWLLGLSVCSVLGP